MNAGAPSGAPCDYDARMKSTLPLAFLLACLAACTSPEDQAYKRARTTDTVVGWENFLRQYPDGTDTAAARQRLTELHEDREWQRAELRDSVASYQEYLRGYPQGRFAGEALVRIANLNLREIPDHEPSPDELRAQHEAREAAAVPAAAAPASPPVLAAQSSESAPKGPTALINRAPASQARPKPAVQAKPGAQSKPAVQPKPVAQPKAAAQPKVVAQPKPAAQAKPAAPAKPAASPPVVVARDEAGDWAVQLGAFGKGEAAALQHWQRLQRAVPAATNGLQPDIGAPVDGKPFHRLRIVGLTREHARELCAAVRGAGEGCVVTAP